MLTYSDYILPLAVLYNMSRTFSDSNIKFKLIPRLIKANLIKRQRIGYNKNFSHNQEQKGKALYDTVVLTKEGVQYLACTNLISEEMKLLREHYKKQIATRNEQTEERLKRTVLCDSMFDVEFALQIIQRQTRLKDRTKKEIQSDLLTNASFRYLPAIEFKRRNGNLDETRKVGTVYDFTTRNGLVLSASKFLGLLDGGHKTFPVYFTAYKNLNLHEKNEQVLLSKLSVGTGSVCADCVYVYQSVDKIKQLVERDDIMPEWQQIHNIIDVMDYQRIYLLPYGRNSTEFRHLNLLMSLQAKDLRDYWNATDCMEYHAYIFAVPYVNEAKKTLQDVFISISDEYNNIIGYLPEVRHLRKVLRYYKENTKAKPLNIVCDASQEKFYEKVFSQIKEQGKLYFSFYKFNFEKNGEVKM